MVLWVEIRPGRWSTAITCKLRYRVSLTRLMLAPTTETSYIGDGEVANYTSWVLSGDMNGTTGNDTTGDGSLGFKAGHYGGVFLGGTGTDTPVFEHNNAGDTAQMYVGLDSGFAMLGNGANSPLVQFADIGATPYALTWSAWKCAAIAMILLLSAAAAGHRCKRGG